MHHLYLAITAHGFGHLAQAAPVVAELVSREPRLRVTLQADIDPAYAAARLPHGFRHLPIPADVALPMDGPLRVRWGEGLARYHAFDADHDAHLDAMCARFAADPPDLVLADVPWVPLAAAARLGLPAAGLCSLTWYDILHEGPLGAALDPGLAARLRAAYAGAPLFLRPAPSMPMAWLPNARDIGPIAACRPRDPAALRARLGLAADTRLVLMQFGGAGHVRLGGGRRLLPGICPSVCLVTPDAAAAAGRDDVRVLGPADPDLLTVLAGCDAVITKPGYGTFAEAAANGIPVLTLERPDWPETRWLLDWLRARVPVREVSAEAFAAGDIGAALAALLAAGPAAPVPATGAAEAADLLLGLLD